MKFKLSILLVLLSSFCLGQTFDYFENDPEWRVSFRYNLGGSPYAPEFISRKDYIYYFNGDSLVNDTLYLKLYERGETTTSSVVENVFNSLNSLVRQEGKRIYQRLDSTEHLLYDFDLEVGDEFPDVLHYGNSGIPLETVQSVDSILINGNYHKTFFNSNQSYPLLIEGIGHWQGVFNEPINIPFDAVYSLHCYRQLGEVEYVTDEWLECNFNVSVAEWEVETSVSVYPNPTSQELTLECSGLPILSVLIYDQIGNTVKSDLKVNSHKVKMDVSDLTSGLYFINIKTAQGVQTEKLVKE